MNLSGSECHKLVLLFDAVEAHEISTPIYPVEGDGNQSGIEALQKIANEQPNAVFLSKELDGDTALEIARKWLDPHAKQRAKDIQAQMKNLSAWSLHKDSLKSHFIGAIIMETMIVACIMELHRRFPNVPLTHLAFLVLPGALSSQAGAHGLIASLTQGLYWFSKWVDKQIMSRSLQPMALPEHEVRHWQGKVSRPMKEAGFPEDIQAFIGWETKENSSRLQLLILDTSKIVPEKPSNAINFSDEVVDRPTPLPKKAKIKMQVPSVILEHQAESETPEAGIIQFEDEDLASFFAVIPMGEDVYVKAARELGFSWQNYARKAAKRLELLSSVSNLAELKQSVGPGQFKKFDKGNGKFTGCYGLEIDKQWRLMFRWEEGEEAPTVITIESYHG